MQTETASIRMKGFVGKFLADYTHLRLVHMLHVRDELPIGYIWLLGVSANCTADGLGIPTTSRGARSLRVPSRRVCFQIRNHVLCTKSRSFYHKC